MFQCTFPRGLVVVALLAAAWPIGVAAGNQLQEGKDWKIGVQIVVNRENGKPTGVLITKVIAGSPADGRLKAKDVIHAVDGKLFDDPKALRDDVMGRDRTEVTLIWQRGSEFLEALCPLKTEIITETYTVKVPRTMERDGRAVTEYVEEERTRSTSKVAGIESIGEPHKVDDPRLPTDKPRRVTDPRRQ